MSVPTKNDPAAMYVVNVPGVGALTYAPVPLHAALAALAAVHRAGATTAVIELDAAPRSIR